MTINEYGALWHRESLMEIDPTYYIRCKHIRPCMHGLNRRHWTRIFALVCNFVCWLGSFLHSQRSLKIHRSNRQPIIPAAHAHRRLSGTDFGSCLSRLQNGLQKPIRKDSGACSGQASEIWNLELQGSRNAQGPPDPKMVSRKQFVKTPEPLLGRPQKSEIWSFKAPEMQGPQETKMVSRKLLVKTLGPVLGRPQKSWIWSFEAPEMPRDLQKPKWSS